MQIAAWLTSIEDQKTEKTNKKLSTEKTPPTIKQMFILVLKQNNILKKGSKNNKIIIK